MVSIKIVIYLNTHKLVITEEAIKDQEHLLYYLNKSKQNLINENQKCLLEEFGRLLIKGLKA